MRIYIDDDSSKKLEKAADGRHKSPEATLKEAVECLDDGEADNPQDDAAGASEVPKTG